MEYTGLTDERYTWAFEIQRGIWNEPYVLQQYRLNRNSNLWRSTREVEKLCEYILHLEGAKPMSETITIRCDYCDADITTSPHYPVYRLRVIEEVRQITADATPVPDEHLLPTPSMNFCNLDHLTQWIEGRGNHEG